MNEKNDFINRLLVKLFHKGFTPDRVTHYDDDEETFIIFKNNNKTLTITLYNDINAFIINDNDQQIVLKSGTLKKNEIIDEVKEFYG